MSEVQPADEKEQQEARAKLKERFGANTRMGGKGKLGSTCRELSPEEEGSDKGQQARRQEDSVGGEEVQPTDDGLYRRG